MKSERRHELQNNQLAHWLVRYIDEIKPYASWIVGGIVVGLLVAMIIVFQRGDSRAERDANWDAYYAAASTGDTEKLKELASQQAGTSLGSIISLNLADIHLAQGSQQAQLNRSEAQKKFEEAANNYASIIKDAKDPLIKNRARFGTGKSYEWLMQIDNAIEAYEQVEGPLKQQAEQRIGDLKLPATVAFYEQYAEFTPQPAIDPTKITPNFDFTPEGDGESDFDLLNPLGPADGDENPGDSDTEPEGGVKPEGETKPEGDKPAEATETETPAETTPAAPATETPAEETAEPKTPAAEEQEPTETKPTEETPAAETTGGESTEAEAEAQPAGEPEAPKPPAAE